MNQENQGVNYSMALKNYNKNGRGIGLRFIRSIRDLRSPCPFHERNGTYPE